MFNIGLSVPDVFNFADFVNKHNNVVANLFANRNILCLDVSLHVV